MKAAHERDRITSKECPESPALASSRHVGVGDIAKVGPQLNEFVAGIDKSPHVLVSTRPRHKQCPVFVRLWTGSSMVLNSFAN